MSQDLTLDRTEDRVRAAARAYVEARSAMIAAFKTPDFQAACAAYQRADRDLQAAVEAELEGGDDGAAG